MAFISFNKATEPSITDDLRINTERVLYVEASRPDLLGRTTIHLLGQGSTVHAVMDSVGTVVSAIGGLVAAKRHYLAALPDDGASTVFFLPSNVSFVRPNQPAAQEFWYLTFVDGSELRIVDPLPAGL
jgi:hypothetical protein